MLSTLARRSAGRLATRVATATRALSSSAPSAGDAPTSFAHDKMETDKRYQGSQAVPESLLQGQSEDSSEFSIRGQFREGRAAYLDMSATTPLDPRVLDAMLPYMVGSCNVDFVLSALMCIYTLNLISLFSAPHRLVPMEIPILERMPLVGNQSVSQKKPELKLLPSLVLVHPKKLSLPVEPPNPII